MEKPTNKCKQVLSRFVRMKTVPYLRVQNIHETKKKQTNKQNQMEEGNNNKMVWETLNHEFYILYYHIPMSPTESDSAFQ